ncbi:heme-copper oxidase family protein [Roseiflexus castenholzii]|uniref:Cbb3-type cytochrome c oxidase subunit I n=1 Tax=Roseiflexus castenholzii (strain DSM 13941 / HLO8) TaxID=383372 RepID=A7NQI6_ROSCS|nr:hypothetical protein [Roseiflexus castenholzii]ABU59832.1 hypothetical protein Rcas_3793 [Roseiflexus castenholzii DSM 13941]
MPRVSVFMIRTALIHLALGAFVGGMLLADKGLHLWSWFWTLRAGHVHLMLLGWTVQFACGVAIWILPRLDAAGTRGALWLAWVCYGALNGGVLLATLSAPFAGMVGRERIAWMLPVAGVLFVAGIAAFIGHGWRRIRPFGAVPARMT